jgi:chemotaxis protein MotB
MSMADDDVIEPSPPPADEDDEDTGSGGVRRSSDAWMLSFGDLVSLMLVFFVMLFSMSTLENELFEAMSSAMAQQFKPSAKVRHAMPSADLAIPMLSSREAYSLDYLRALIDDKLAGDPILGDIRLHQLDDRLVVSLPSDPLFEPGGARLKEKARDTVARIVTVIHFLGNRIDINSHTDPEPVADPAFASNWEYTLARAIAVANGLRRAGFTEDIHAFGLGDTRFAEISLDLSVDERTRRARRIDIVIRRHAAKGGA